MTCRHKAHCFYFPNGLFNDSYVPQETLGEPRFQNKRLASKLYHMKHRVKGRDPVIRRGKRTATSDLVLESTQGTSQVRKKRGRPRNSSSKKAAPSRHSATRVLFKLTQRKRLARKARTKKR